MTESSAFQVIENLAEERRVRHIVRKLAISRFGQPTEARAAKLAAIDTPDRLDRLASRLRTIDSGTHS